MPGTFLVEADRLDASFDPWPPEGIAEAYYVRLTLSARFYFHKATQWTAWRGGLKTSGDENVLFIKVADRNGTWEAVEIADALRACKPVTDPKAWIAGTKP